MKILILLVLSLCGFAISAPFCNYITIDTKYVCLMNSSTATTGDIIGGAHTGTDKTADNVYRVTTLDAANKNLISIVLSAFKNLEVLQIQKGSVASIDTDDFPNGKCINLKQLQIWSGQINNLGSSNMFTTCPLLEEIDLTDNKLTKIESGLLPTTLKKLILTSNTINPNSDVSTIFKTTTSLPVLTNFSLSGNTISSLTNFNLPSEIITHLDFSNNQLTEIPTASLKVSKIVNLYLNKNKLASISNTTVNTMVDLVELKLGSNLIGTIQEDAFKLNTKLTSLDISANPLKSLNENLLKTLVNLISLDIHDIQLESSNLKTILDTLVNLQVLDISSNSLEELHEQLFEKSTAMKKLTAKENKVVTLKASTFEKMKNLEVLDFSSNKINKIEKTFFDQFTNLKEVRFSANTCINEDFPTFTKDDATMAKFKKCFDNYNSARPIVISNVLLILVVVVSKFM